MRIYIIISLILITFTFESFGQTVDKKYKILKKEEFEQSISQLHGVKVPNPYFSFCNFYECDDNRLIIENIIEKRYTLYYDRSQYYRKMNKILSANVNESLHQNQATIKNIKENVPVILKKFYLTLGIPIPDHVSNVILKDVDLKIRKIGLTKIYNRHLLELLVFAGEYINSKKGGHWTTTIDDGKEHLLIPVFVDGEGRNYSFEINALITKNFIERKYIHLEEIIENALLPSVRE